MYQKLLPHLFYKNVYEIDFEALWEKGIRGLIFDLDNTLCSYSTAEPDEKNRALIRRLKEKGYQIWLVSNNSRERVERYNRSLGLPVIANAKKPLQSALSRALRQMGLPRSQVALVGDQIYTDMLGGNRAGLMTILVQPVEERENWFFRLKRQMEEPVIRHFQRHGRKGE
ncbi:MAG: YqeG family HAD IIIA-type phosphatase [Eubacteriales bacterium]|jgi:HAD superfamily phosphatase (TIGR01668 family)